MKAALVCIAKNEDHYIDEWIAYHKLLGFDRIFVYQNDWRYNINDEMVQVVPLDGRQKQLEAYNSFCSQNIKNYDWAAFIDVDEFILLKKHKNVKDFIANHARGFSAIAMNWAMFVRNNLVFDGNYSLLKRFTKRQKRPNRHIKIFLKLSENLRMILPHHANTPSVDTNGKSFNGPWNNDGPIDVIQLNHYYWKTQKEWENKIARGRADTPSGAYLSSDITAASNINNEFALCESDVVEDYDILNVCQQP